MRFTPDVIRTGVFRPYAVGLGLCLACGLAFGGYVHLEDDFPGQWLDGSVWTFGGQWQPTVTVANGKLSLGNQQTGHFSFARSVEEFNFHENEYEVIVDLDSFDEPDWSNAPQSFSNMEVYFSIGPAESRGDINSSDTSRTGFSFNLRWRRDHGLDITTRSNVGVPGSGLAAVPSVVRFTLNAADYVVELFDADGGSIYYETGAHGLTSLSSYHFMLMHQAGMTHEVDGSATPHVAVFDSVVVKSDEPLAPPTGKWGAFEVVDEIAGTGDWLGDVHLMGGDWVYIEAFERHFFALPVANLGVWLYCWEDQDFEAGFQSTEGWLGSVYSIGDVVYSFDLGRWFIVKRAAGQTGNWYYSVRMLPTIPADRVIDWSIAGVQGGIPDVPVAVELTPSDLPSGEESNAAPAIQAALDEVHAAGEHGAVLLPEGTYYVKEPINMREGVVLRGRGLDKTFLIFDVPGGQFDGGVIHFGGGRAFRRAITEGYEAGSRELVLASVGHLEVGQLVRLDSENDLEEMYGTATYGGNLSESWKVAGRSYAARAVHQIVRIEEIDEETRTVVLDVPVRLSRMHLDPRLEPMYTMKWAGLESVHITRLDTASGVIIRFDHAENCWVRDCETHLANRVHIHMGASRFLTIESNYIHDAHNFSGGHAYGVQGGNDNLVWNNVFRRLRHAMLSSFGRNGNVWAYNFSSEQDQDTTDRLRDISVHGHYTYMELFEGNVAEFATSSDYWGAAGPLVTFYRNRFDTTLNHKPNYGGWNAPLQIMNGSHWQNVVGNSMVSGQGIDVKDDSKYALVEGNMVRGSIVWNDAGEPWHLPPSLFLSGPPHFWGDTPWPAIGADVDYQSVRDGEDYTRIPAQQWGEKMFAEGRTMPFAEAMGQ